MGHLVLLTHAIGIHAILETVQSRSTLRDKCELFDFAYGSYHSRDFTCPVFTC